MTEPYDEKEFYLDMNVLHYFWFQEQPKEKQEAILEMLERLKCPAITELFTQYPYVIAGGKK